MITEIKADPISIDEVFFDFLDFYVPKNASDKEMQEAFEKASKLTFTFAAGVIHGMARAGIGITPDNDDCEKCPNDETCCKFDYSYSTTKWEELKKAVMQGEPLRTDSKEECKEEPPVVEKYTERHIDWMYGKWFKHKKHFDPVQALNPHPECYATVIYRWFDSDGDEYIDFSDTSEFLEEVEDPR